MSRILSSALSMRRDPRLLKLPPYMSFFCIMIGVVWLFLLPMDSYSRRTYISENALLPGQVHTYFGGSEQHILRAYRHEIDLVGGKSPYEVNTKLEGILNSVGVKVGRQNYTYHTAGELYSGENVYGILQAPRGDATEAIVLVAAWQSIDGQINRNGVALALTLIRYFKKWSLWSKDIIILLPQDSRTGIQAWVDAYHDAHDPDHIAPLPLKSGALQGAIAIDYPQEQRYDEVHVIYDGTNGQLPNLDLMNSIVNIAGGQMGIETVVQGVSQHGSTYQDRLRTMFLGMLSQGIGYATGPHSSFIPYHIDAVTLKPRGEGWHDEMAMGRVIEGSFRSLNNLLEHLHQSFFFYLLMQKDRFVSIGTYLPSAMLLAANFTLMAISLWVKSGQSSLQAVQKSSPNRNVQMVSSIKETVSSAPSHRDTYLPLGVVVACQSISALPLFIFNNLPVHMLSSAFALFTLASATSPLIISYVIGTFYQSTPRQFLLIKSFSLLILGMSVATLATLNFSLAFLVGLLASPLTFVGPTKNILSRWSVIVLLNAISPSAVVYVACRTYGITIESVLREASFGWNVWGVYTPVVFWCLWWPAWLVGLISVLGPLSTF